MKTLRPEDFVIPPEEIAAMKRDESREPAPKKKSGFKFIRVPLTVCRKLAREDAVWAMFCALYETWFTTGRKDEHPNPFPLNRCDTGKWGLTRMQKSRALRALVEARLIKIRRRNRKNALITVTWASRFVPRVVTKTSSVVTKTSSVVTPALHVTSEERLLSSSSITSPNKYVRTKSD